MNPGVIDVQNSHKRACQPGDGWIFAGGGAVGRYGVASRNWVIRALTVQTGAPRSAMRHSSGQGLWGTETCFDD